MTRHLPASPARPSASSGGSPCAIAGGRPGGTHPSKQTMHFEKSLTEHLRQLEERLTQPDIRRSAQELDQLLADDFREFGGSGRSFDKPQIIAALKTQPPCSIWVEEFQATGLAPDVVLVTYRGNCRFANSEKISSSLRSSIWRHLEGRWQVVFHQGTPTGEAIPGGGPS